MIWDYAENIFQLLAELVALLLCLFYYISSKRREWIYGLLFFLCGVLSSYFFAAYLRLRTGLRSLREMEKLSAGSIF